VSSTKIGALGVKQMCVQNMGTRLVMRLGVLLTSSEVNVAPFGWGKN
jgi:hypothetical protein